MNNFYNQNDYTQVSTDSDISSNTLDFKINLNAQKSKVEASDAQREIFADQKPKAQILKEFSAMRNQKMKNDRNKKRQNFISRKRQLIQQKQSPDMYIESGPMEMINYEAERQAHFESNRVDFDSMQKSKSEIYVVCQKIKNNQNEQDQVEGINQLNEYLVRREKNEKQMFFSSTIFQILETGVSRTLLFMLDNVQDGKIKFKLSQIFINLALGEKREIMKLTGSGLVQILANQIKTSTEAPHIINCIWALSNIVSTSIDGRDAVMDKFPDVFPVMMKLMDHYAVHYQLHGEIMFFTKNIFGIQDIHCDSFLRSYVPGIKLLAKSLENFDFTDPNNYCETKSMGQVLEREADQFLFGIVISLCNLIDNELKINKESDPLMLQFGTQSVDSVINECNLFLPLMRILQYTADEVLEEKTLKIIGFLCTCEYSATNVTNLVANQHQNIIKLLHKNLVSRKMPKANLRATLFVLSNIIADRSGHLQSILELNLITIMTKIWDQIISTQPKDHFERDQLSNLKTEIIYCMGNCCLSIKDTLIGQGAFLLQESLKQGALTVLAQALNNQNTSALGLNIALEGLHRYFRFFKVAEKHNSWDGKVESILLEFERLGGLDGLESCQLNSDTKVYHKSQKILQRYFEIEADQDPLLRFITDLTDKAQNNQNGGNLQTMENLETVQNNNLNGVMQCPEDLHI